MSKNLINLTFGGSFGLYNQIPDGFYILKLNYQIFKFAEPSRGCKKKYIYIYIYIVSIKNYLC